MNKTKDCLECALQYQGYCMATVCDGKVAMMQVPQKDVD